MSITAKVYPKAQEQITHLGLDLDTLTLKCMLLTACTYNAADATITDVKTHATEVASGGGYTTGGVTLTSVTITTSGDVTTIDCDDPQWAASTISAAFAVFYVSGASDTLSYPLVRWDLGGSQSTVAGTFKLTINASGLITLTSV